VLLASTQVFGASTNTNGIPAEVSADPRVELFSIIFRLAGNPEYCRSIVLAYVKDADKYFKPFRSHDVILLAKKLRSTRDVSYNAPMSLAIHLNDATELKERIPLQPRPASLDRRWQPAELA